MQATWTTRQQQAIGAQRDLAALIAERNGYIQSWHADIADKLTDALSKLSDARELLNKAQLRRQLVELRRRTGRHGADGQQGVGRVGAERPASSSSPWCRPTRRWRSRPISPAATTATSCRRSGRYQVRHLPVHAVRPGARRRPDRQPRQLHRAGRAAQPDRLGAAVQQQAQGVFYRAGSPWIRSTCMVRRRTSIWSPACRSPPISGSASRPCFATCWARSMPLATEGMREP